MTNEEVNRMINKINPDIPMLRKAVEWVEFQAALPEIDREWVQESYLTRPHDRAVGLAHAAIYSRIERQLMTYNEINQVAARIEPHCGTAYCVAGYIAAHVDPRYVSNDVVNGVHSSLVAIEALGITHEQAKDLFHGSNTAEKVRRIAERIAGEPL
jgi:hypothetical protein